MNVEICGMLEPPNTDAHQTLVFVASSNNDNYACHDWLHVIQINILTTWKTKLAPKYFLIKMIVHNWGQFVMEPQNQPIKQF